MVLVKHGLGKNMVSSSTLITNSLLTQQSQQNHSNVKSFRGYYSLSINLNDNKIVVQR